MAEAEKQNFLQKVRAALSGAFKAEDKSLGDKFRSAWNNLNSGQDSAADSVRAAANATREKAGRGMDRVLGVERSGQVKDFTGKLATDFKNMNGVNQTASVLGAGMALEGAVSTVNNLRHGRIKRAVFSAARVGLGVAMDYASFKAHSNDQNLFEFGKSFVQREMERRSGAKGNSQGHGV